MSKSLIAFDTDHIKGYVFGTNKLKEIRGASSILDRLNRVRTRELAKVRFKADTIYAHGGSALFLVDSDKAERLGKAVQKLYAERTGGGASITYAIQLVPDNKSPDPIMTATELSGGVTMKQVLDLLRLRLRLAKDSLQSGGSRKGQFQEDAIAVPSHTLLYTCDSCGISYTEGRLRDPDDPEGLYCRVCDKKRKQDRVERTLLSRGSVSDQTLWMRIIQTLKRTDSADIPHYEIPVMPERPQDFNVFREFTRGKESLGLIYADGNGMGQAIEKLETLQKVQDFAQAIDKAVFKAMGDAIKLHLPMQQNKFPFDVLLIGGDDIVMVTPANKALQVATTLAERFHMYMNQKCTLSVGVVLAPINYPFALQRQLAEEAIKDAKKVGAESKSNRSTQEEQSRVNFVVVTGNTSSSYANIYQQLYQKKRITGEKFYATMRPYSLEDLLWLMDQIKLGNEKRLGRTKLHQLREAILKKNNTTAILESLVLLHNWKEQERNFIKQIVKRYDQRSWQQQRNETLFPWYLDGQQDSENGSKKEIVYRTPLLDFIELYDFVSS